ncbi:hypothetical protein [Desulfoluna sp.]|uniref:hypothetical protein n=1 Tax=Desulfoluna sp. TaxID=2045199 RepID=UPI002607FD13|nr:hypothetical protein [Desulfoluna sp.]
MARVEPVDRRALYARAYKAPREEQLVDVRPYLSQFGDIPIPGELYEVAEHTMIMETRGERTGFIVYSGRVLKTSLEIFFRGELKKKGWEMVTAFASEASTVLLFNKTSRWCVIILDARGPATDVRLGVSQDLGLAARLLGH